MNSQEKPHPSGAQPVPSLPPRTIADEADAGDTPKRPARKSKGREPPPRPKSRPVSELPAADEEKETVHGAVAAGPPPQVVCEANGTSNGHQVGHETAAIAKKADPLVPQKNKQTPAVGIPNDVQKVEGAQGGEAKKSSKEFNEAVLEKAEAPLLKKRAAPTVIRAKPAEEPECDFRPPEGIREQEIEINSVSDAKTDASDIEKEAPTTRTKKLKPTVILAKPPKKEEMPQGKTDLRPEAKPKPAGKPPPLAVKPRPASLVNPQAEAPGSGEIPRDVLSEESRVDKKRDAVPSVTKPRGKPTIIAAKPIEPEQGEELSEKVRNTEKKKPPAKPPSPSPPIKPKRLPTVIQPKRPDSSGSVAGTPAERQDTKEQPSPTVGQKPPEKPTRGPSIKRPEKPKKPPQRPVTVPSVNDSWGNTKWYVALDEGPPEEPKPARPDGGATSPMIEHKDYDSAEEKVTNNVAPGLTRKGSQTKPPVKPAPPRANPRDSEVSGEEPAVSRALETTDDRDSRKEEPALSRKGSRTKPPPPIPNLPGRARAEGNESQHESAKPARPSPQRPASVSGYQAVARDEKPAAAEQENASKSNTLRPKAAPRRPRPVSQPDLRPTEEVATEVQQNGSKETAVKPIALSHVQPIPGAREQEQEPTLDQKPSREQEPSREQSAKTDKELHRTKKTKPRPPRPSSVVDKPQNEVQDVAADVQEDEKTKAKSKPKPPRPAASTVKSRPPRPAGVQRCALL